PERRGYPAGNLGEGAMARFPTTDSLFRRPRRSSPYRRRLPLSVELLEPRVLLSSDLAERNAILWRLTASDGADSTLADDTTRVRSGEGSLRLVTSSGADVSLRYDGPAGGDE